MTNEISDDQKFSLFTVKVKFVDTKKTSIGNEKNVWQPFHSWKQERSEENHKLICDHQTAYNRQNRVIQTLYSPYRCAMLYINVTREGRFCKSKEDKGIALKKYVYGRYSNQIHSELQFAETKRGVVLANVRVEIREGMTIKEMFLININQQEMDEHITMNYVFWKKKMEEYFYVQKKMWNETQYLQMKAI